MSLRLENTENTHTFIFKSSLSGTNVPTTFKVTVLTLFPDSGLKTLTEALGLDLLDLMHCYQTTCMNEHVLGVPN